MTAMFRLEKMDFYRKEVLRDMAKPSLWMQMVANEIEYEYEKRKKYQKQQRVLSKKEFREKVMRDRDLEELEE